MFLFFFLSALVVIQYELVYKAPCGVSTKCCVYNKILEIIKTFKKHFSSLSSTSEVTIHFKNHVDIDGWLNVISVGLYSHCAALALCSFS